MPPPSAKLSASPTSSIQRQDYNNWKAAEFMCEVNGNIRHRIAQGMRPRSTVRHSVATPNQAERLRKLQQGVDRADCNAFGARVTNYAKCPGSAMIAYLERVWLSDPIQPYLRMTQNYWCRRLMHAVFDLVLVNWAQCAAFL